MTGSGPAARWRRRTGASPLSMFAAAALSASLLLTSAAGASPDVAAEYWESTLFQGKKVGFSYLKVDQGEEGYQITGRAVLKLTLMGVSQDMSFTSEAFLDKEGALKRFNYMQTMQSQRQKTEAVVKEGAIQMVIIGAGGGKKVTVKAPPDVTLGHIAEYFFNLDLHEGKEAVYPVFIEATRSVSPMRMKVTGRKRVKNGGAFVDAFVVESEMQGVKTVTHVAPGGRKLSAFSLMGITAQATTEEDAVELAGADVPLTSIITFSLITPDKPVRSQETLELLRVTINGLSSPEMISDDRQSVGEPQRVLDGKGGRTFSAPLTIRRVGPPQDTLSMAQAAAAMPGELAPTPEVQSDNKLIIKTAGQIVGGETDSWKAAVKINQWVFKTLKKEFVDSFTAVDVLLEKKGECQSHTNLFVALARAAGLPAKVTGGLVHSKSHEGFLYHAWPEVYVGKWVAMDPTLGQDVADPTHIKLIEGGVESLMSLMRYITKISINIEEAR